jgi:CDP-4-dehydro-6-deoxyglucose reductase
MAFIIRLQPGGEEFSAELGETVLDAALRQGLPLPHSCREGRCKSCRASLLSGQVEDGSADPTPRAILLCRTLARSDLVIGARPVAALAGIVPRILPVRVLRLERLAPDVMALTLKLPGGEPFRFRPGQHVDILFRDGHRRSYSLAGSPAARDTIELHVRRVAGGRFSDLAFHGLREKDLLRIHGPLGSFVLDLPSPRARLLVAGGTGFAPFQGLLAQSAVPPPAPSLHLYWGVRSPSDLYRHAELLAACRRHPWLRYTPVVSQPPDAHAPEWSGRTGLVHAAVLADYPDLSGLSVYACGPPPMVAAARTAFAARGLPAEHLHADSFEYAAA